LCVLCDNILLFFTSITNLNAYMNTSKVDDFCFDAFVDKSEVCATFDIMFSRNTKHYLLVSWGSDSMLMAHLLFRYVKIKNLSHHEIFVLHFNHKQRKVSDDEEQTLCNYFSKHVCICEEYLWSSWTELELRKARRDFVERVVNSKWPWVVYTWHNLSDRFETSCLNLLRWCKTPGVYNMSTIDVSITFDKKFTICRPLLNFSKKYVLSICDTMSIPFVDDVSNYDTEVSKRNWVRKITNDLGLFEDIEDIVYISFYTTKQKRVWFPVLCRLPSFESFVKTVVFKTQLNMGMKGLYDLLFYVNCGNWLTTPLLLEVHKFLSTWSSWRKRIWSWYFCIAHWFLYIIDALDSQPFWLDAHITKRIRAKIVGSLTDALRDWESLRFMQPWDRYWSVRLSKFFIKNKIPFFFRPYIPIVVKDSKVIRVLLSVWYPWYM